MRVPARQTGQPRQQTVVRDLLSGYGDTYAAQAGIRIADTPQPLYRTLVLSLLLSARIRASVAVAATRALYDAGLRDARRMRDASWQQRVDALGAGGYRRYDERTATQLGDGAQLVLDAWGGNLRRLRHEADGDMDQLRRGLRRLPGIGPAGADIFLREVQGVWPEVAPYLDPKALQGARSLGLPDDRTALARLSHRAHADPASFAAALVRAALDPHVVEECLHERVS
ncbi:endonuclease [Streptomyces sp. NPDC058045]|uniref:endonuclease n=1 Tax=Streptomyces sp. NPDC058045 TaxID=3346311 RepID=UPI0036DFDB39